MKHFFRVTTCFAMVAVFACVSSAQSVIYSSDFENDPGGWISGGFGDWEHGVYDVANYTGIHSPPPSAFSGDFVWGTVLNGDYTNSGETSSLSQTFDLTGYSTANLSFQSWAEVFYSFDLGEL